MTAPNTLRITLLGKTGVGKSSLGNIILGNDAFTVKRCTKSEPSSCEAQNRSVNGRNLTVVDTPGFFYPESSEEELKQEILRCTTECAPGPRAFLLVFKMETFTEQEEEVITKIEEYFSAEVFKFCIIVFTHDDQLSEDTKIETHISKNERLSSLLEKCGGRCHVVDNKYWNRNNQKQVEQLLQTIEEVLRQAGGGCYTTEMMQNWQKKQNSSQIKISDFIIKHTWKYLCGMFIVVLVSTFVLMLRILRHHLA